MQSQHGTLERAGSRCGSPTGSPLSSALTPPGWGGWGKSTGKSTGGRELAWHIVSQGGSWHPTEPRGKLGVLVQNLGRSQTDPRCPWGPPLRVPSGLLERKFCSKALPYLLRTPQCPFLHPLPPSRVPQDRLIPLLGCEDTLQQARPHVPSYLPGDPRSKFCFGITGDLFWTTNGGAQGLVMALYSEIAPRR